LGHHKKAESPAMLEASWRSADAVVAQKTRQTDPQDFWVGL